MRNAVFIALLALLAACARSNAPIGELPVGIIGGRAVGSGDLIARSTAFVLLYDSQTHDAAMCSAVLISKDLLLTAAHCFWPASGPRRDRSYTKFVIFGGPVDIQSAETFKRAIVIPETNYALHPGYSNQSNKDSIALIRLPTLAPTSATPVRILPPSLKPANPVTVAGFGIEADSSSQPPTVYNLNSLVTTLGSNQDPDCPVCVNLRETPIARPAHGDSGGPAYSNLNGVTYVWGIDSHTINSAYTDEYYTPIAPYLSWIQQTGKALGSVSAISLQTASTSKLTSSKSQPGKSLSKSNAYSPASKPQHARNRA